MSYLGPHAISLCVITGNEAETIIRFLNSFADAFDELCLVRAIGAQQPDETLNLAKKWCAEHGKVWQWSEYRNRANFTGRPTTEDGKPVIDPDNPATWPHVDDFAAARNAAWRMATCPWQFWADVDDILIKPAPGTPGGAELIRLCAAADTHDQFFFKYSIRLQSESNVRERLFRTGQSVWIQPVHEQCRVITEQLPNGKQSRGLIEERVIYEHAPTAEKKRDPHRNRRIIQYALRYLNAYAFEMHREHFYEWQATRTPDAKEKATYWAEVTLATNCITEQRYDTVLNQAQIAASAGDFDHAVELVWAAIRMMPANRTAWGDGARYHLRAGHGQLAALMTTFMQGIQKPPSTGYPRAEKYHGWQGYELRLQSLRAAGRGILAAETEAKVFAENGSRISVLHATRGRAKQALATKELWLSAAVVPLGIEWIFAIDSDDEESRALLANHHHIIVEKGGGCVRAWNAAAAAATGNVLVQMSDDWTPCHDWDELVWSALLEAGKKRTNDEARQARERLSGKDEQTAHRMERLTVGKTPMVLAIREHHRDDALLCMAILTRARYLQQRDTTEGAPYLFSPEYLGVFSDNEFTVRAYDDGVIVPAPHILFRHDHPLFAGTPPEKWDQVYRDQNALGRYAHGREVFNRRNPKHALP